MLALLLLLILYAATAYAENSVQVVLSFAGDCTLGSMKHQQSYSSTFVGRMAELGLEYPFSGVKHIFEEDDLTLVNLEGVFTLRNQSQDKAFLFKSPPSYAEILPLGGVEAVNIANNHIRDFFEAGRLDTIDALEEQGILYCGDGELAVYEAKGVTIGMTGYSYPHRKTLEKLEADIVSLREMGCDIIILSMHAGTEEQYRETLDQRNVARGAIDLGVDIVVGHHPHVVQGVELYGGKPIFYSLGNFAFGGNNNPKDWDSMIAQVVITREGEKVSLSEIRIIPCLISGATERRNDYRPVPAEGERAAAILEKIGSYSPNIPESLFSLGILPLEGIEIQAD